MGATRRGFFKLSAIGLVASSTLSSTACWINQNVFHQILAYVAVGMQAFQSVVDLLTGAGGIPVGTGTAIDIVVNLVKAGFADLQTAVENYNNAPADQKTTLSQKIATAVADLQSNIQQFWNDLKVPDQKLESTIKGLLGIILSTLAGFSASLPAPAQTPAQLKLKALSKTLPVTPQKRTARQFKGDFNKVLNDNGYSQYVVR